MIVGYLGNIVFEVTADKIETFNNASWGGSASYGTHQRHNGTTLLEFVGSDADTFSFDIKLSAELGVDVMGEIKKILTAERNGEILRLVIGKKSYGRYRWVIKKHTVKMKYYDRRGNLTAADVSLSLTEYIKG